MAQGRSRQTGLLRRLPFTIERSDCEGPGSWIPRGYGQMAETPTLPYPLPEDWALAHATTKESLAACGRGTSEDTHPEYARAIADYLAASRVLGQIRKDQDAVASLEDARDALARDKLRLKPARQALRGVERVLRDRKQQQVVVLYLFDGSAAYVPPRTANKQLHGATEDWLAWRLMRALDSESEQTPAKVSLFKAVDPATSLIAETFKRLGIGKGKAQRAGDSAIRNRISRFQKELERMPIPEEANADQKAMPSGFQGIYATPEEAAARTSAETGIEAFLPVVFRAVGASGVKIKEVFPYQSNESLTSDEILEYFEEAAERLGLGIIFNRPPEPSGPSCIERDGMPLRLPAGPLSIECLVGIAHDLGHLEAAVGSVPPWAVDRCGGPPHPSLQEEAAAWTIAEGHLRRLGFQDWAAFHVRKSASLAPLPGFAGPVSR